jgi:hypothetical protein
MTYIRTKDGRIIELPKEPTLMKYENVILDLNAVRKGKVGYEIINALIDKQADTIEELCDEFVCDKFVHNNLKELLEFGELGRYVGGIIYGAIWTDKGLIYVAKMNEKGVLELL